LYAGFLCNVKKKRKDKITPFRFSPLRNFPKTSTPPFCAAFIRYKKLPQKSGQKSLVRQNEKSKQKENMATTQKVKPQPCLASC
jgi:hypothetical protein